MNKIIDILGDFDNSMNSLQSSFGKLPYADPHKSSTDVECDILAEGIFIRGFTAFENCLEELFLHFSSGGETKSGNTPTSRIAGCSREEARQIIKNGHRFLDWSNPRSVKERSAIFFKDGEPFNTQINSISHSFSDAEKIRNMIAHDSLESGIAYIEVQTRLFTAERPFKMTPGHLLRTRNHKRKLHQCAVYFSDLADAVHLLSK